MIDISFSFQLKKNVIETITYTGPSLLVKITLVEVIKKCIINMAFLQPL
jgi:hypothetical protein